MITCRFTQVNGAILLLGHHFLVDLIAGNIIYGQLVSDGMSSFLLGEEMKPPGAAAFHKHL